MLIIKNISRARLFLLTTDITAEYFYPETNHPRVFADREDPDGLGEDPLQEDLHLTVGVRVGLSLLRHCPPASVSLQYLGREKLIMIIKDY